MSKCSELNGFYNFSPTVSLCSEGGFVLLFGSYSLGREWTRRSSVIPVRFSMCLGKRVCGVCRGERVCNGCRGREGMWWRKMYVGGERVCGEGRCM